MPTEAERAWVEDILQWHGFQCRCDPEENPPSYCARFCQAQADAILTALAQAREAERERIAVMAETMQNGFARGHAIAAAIRKGE